MKAFISPWVRSAQAGMWARIILLTFCLLAGLMGCQPEKKEPVSSFTRTAACRPAQSQWKPVAPGDRFTGKALPAVTRLAPGHPPLA
jgi:hypothetical protein